MRRRYGQMGRRSWNAPFRLGAKDDEADLSEARLEFLRERNGVRGRRWRFRSKVGSEENLTGVGLRWIGMRAHGEDRNSYGAKNLFGDRAEKHFCESGAAPGSNDHEIGIVFLDGSIQARLDIPFFDQHLRVDPGKGVDKFFAMLFVKDLGGLEVGWPGSGLGHRVDDRSANVQGHEVRLKMSGYFLDEGNGVRGVRRKIGWKQDVFKSGAGLCGSANRGT